MDRRGIVLLALLSGLLADAGTGIAFAKDESGDGPGHPTATVARFDQAPKVDGKLAEGEWDRAMLIQPFMHFKKLRFEPRHARGYVGFTEDRLYVAIVSGVSSRGPRANKRFRDAKLVYDSGIEVWVDPHRGSGGGDGESYYKFVGNSRGTIKDVRFDSSGAPDTGWNGDWTYANSVDMDARRWTAELSIPWSELGWEGEPAGRSIGLLLARNFKSNWNQVAWMPLGAGFVNKGEYPRIRLTEDAPTVRIESLGEKFFSGQVDMKLRVVNPGPARQVKVRALAESTTMPQYPGEKTLQVPAGGEATYRFKVPEQRFQPDATHTLHLNVTDPSGEKVYLRHEGANWTQTGDQIWHTSDRVNPKRAVRIGYYPSHGFVKFRVAPKWLGEDAQVGDSASVTVTGPDGKTVAKEEFQWDEAPAQRRVELGEKLAEGQYNMTIDVAGRDEPFERHFTHKRFPWEDNTLGITDKVYPPFEPVDLDEENERVGVVQREYDKSGLGLWRQVRALEEPLLAGPMKLRVNGEATLDGEGKFVGHGKQQAEYRGRADHPAVRVKTRTRTEYDGCMRVEMDLLPGTEQKELSNLTLDIPVKDSQAPLWHVSTTATRVNPAGKPPEGTGRIWDTRDFPDGEWYGGFRPYIWLGGERRGLCWFADNDKGWVIDVDPKKGTYDPALSLHRKDGQLMLRVHFVQKPITLKEKRHIVFGLMATPAKPMPDGWRKYGRPDYKQLRFSMGTLFGMAGTFNSKYPYNRGFSIFSAAQAARLGAKVNTRAVIDSWKQRNAADLPEDAQRELTGHMDGAIRRARKAGRDEMTLYFEEFHSTNAHHEEVVSYEAEWTGGWNNQSRGRTPDSAGALDRRVRTKNITDSYRDFACWYGAEWLRRGFGLYFDNSFPKRAYDPVTTSAYRTPDGTIQPSAGMWAHRKYLKRIWVLHQQFDNPRTPPIMMIHMTNVHVAPYMVWNESNLDLEWLMTADPAQSKYAPDLLRAEALGLQTGNIPVVIADARQGNPSKEQKRRALRTRWGAMLVHEIRGKRRATIDSLPEPMVEFGYGLEDCKVYNYWDDDPPLKIDDPKCKWLLLERDGRLMMLLCTWNPDGRELTVRVDADQLGVGSPTEAINAETDEKVAPVDGGAFRFRMNGYGVRIFELR